MSLTKATTGPLAGFETLPIDMTRVLSILHNAQALGVTYGLGSKSPDITSKSINFKKIDCSGFMRYLFYQAAGVTIPDGSTNQNDWAAKQGFKHGDHASYAASAGAHDGHVRLCFCRASASEPIGHVWLTYNGFTIESHGGHGPNSRAWNTPILSHIVTDTFVLS